MMAQLTRVLTLILSTTCWLFGQQAPPESSATFHSETELVLTTFNVVRGIYFASDVEPDDVVLLEDGKPRDFTTFEGPRTGRRPPLELALLFDTTTLPPPESKITVRWTHWDRKATYDFTSHWGDKESRAVLEKGGADVRVSVYRYDHQQMQRLCRSTSDPQTLTNAIHRLPEAIPAGEAIPLRLPPHRSALTWADPKRLVWPLSWTQEAVIETLKEEAAAPGKAMRSLVVFSETAGPTNTQPQDVADQANALGIPVYPVVLDFDEYLHHPFVIGVSRSGGLPNVEGAAPISRPDWAGPAAAAGGQPANPTPAAEAAAPTPRPASAQDDQYSAIRRAPTVGNMSTVAGTRFGSLGELTGGGSLYPSRLDAETVDHILNIVRDEGLSQCVVGFPPPPSGRLRKHRLEIKLKSKSTGKLVGGQRTAVY